MSLGVVRKNKPDTSLREELAKRLKDLRTLKFGDLSPEDIVEREKADVSARSIRESEKPESCNPQIDTLDKLARLYGSSLGDLLSFRSSREHGAMVSDLRALVAQDPAIGEAIRLLLSRIRLK